MRTISIKFCSLFSCLSVLAALSIVSAAETVPQQAKASSDDETVWHDCQSLVVEGKGWADTKSGRILRTIHQKLTAEGVKNLHFLSNEGMLGDDTEGTVDGCHPNDLGMMRQAEVFAKALAPLLANRK